VTFTLKAKELSYWNSNFNRFEIEHDKIQGMVGRSSSDMEASNVATLKE